jgi:hypothetical protein
MRAHLSWQLRLLSICILPLSSTLLKAAPSSAKPVARPVTTGSLFYVDIDPPLFIQFENGIRSKFGHDLNAPAWIYAKAFDEVWFARRLVDTHPVGGIVVNRELAFGELNKSQDVGLYGLILLVFLLVGILIQLAILQRRHVRQLDDRQKTENLITQIARKLIHLPREVINKEIESVFLQVREFFDVDLVGLFECSSAIITLRLISARGAIGTSHPAI